MCDNPGLVAFWKYDLYPYLVWGDVDKLSPKGFHVNSHQYVIGFNSPHLVAILNTDDAADIINELKARKQNYNQMLKEIHKEAKDYIETVLKEN